MDWFKKLVVEIQKKNAHEVILQGLNPSLWSTSSGLEVGPPIFSNLKLMVRAIQEFSWERGLRLDPKSPFASGVEMNNQYRWQFVMPTISVEGPLISVRKHLFHELKLSHFSWQQNTLKDFRESFFKGSHFIICGPTGSGKTTFLNALLSEFCKGERVILLERYGELPTASPLWSHLRPGSFHNINGVEALKSLWRLTLRLRPDRVILGEMTDQDIPVFWDIASSGHKGAITTFHAKSSSDVHRRLRLFLQGRGADEEFVKNFACVILSRGAPPCIEEVAPLAF